LKTIAVIGGDKRQIRLIELLLHNGYKVLSAGFEKAERLPEKTHRASATDAAQAAEIIIFPLPVSQDMCTIHAPYSRYEIGIESLAKSIGEGKIIFGGRIKKDLFGKNRIYDYYEREEFQISNAIATAEGAIEVASRELDTTLFGTKTLVAGYGRIGKLLAKILDAYGADVTVSARKHEDFIWIKALGYRSIDTRKLADHVAEYDLIINTVPFRIFNESVLNAVKNGVLLIDLASRPGGVDFDYAESKNIRFISALALPGKTAPVTAGEIIYETIDHILKEEFE